MLIYALTIVGAFIVAVGEIIQQRTAAEAPPEHTLSLRLLWWLVRRPRWLGGLGCSTVGNLLFSTAVGFGSVALVEAVFVVRLLFALVLAAAAGRHRVPLRDVAGALAITVGLVVFILTAHPTKASPGPVPPLSWAISGGLVVALAIALTAVARRLGPARKAALLGTGGGILAGLQASLTQNCVHILGAGGVLALVRTWDGYAVVAVAVGSMVLVQSAFETAPLAASYPAVVSTELIAGIAIGIGVVGGHLDLQPIALGAGVVALGVMIGGIYLLTTSPLVTGQLDELIRAQDIGLAVRTEVRLANELRWAEDALAHPGQHRGKERKLRRELAHIEQGIERLRELQRDICEHRDAELTRLDGLAETERGRQLAQHRALLQRESAIDEQARKLREHADTLSTAIEGGTQDRA